MQFFKLFLKNDIFLFICLFFSYKLVNKTHNVNRKRTYPPTYLVTYLTFLTFLPSYLYYLLTSYLPDCVLAYLPTYLLKYLPTDILIFLPTNSRTYLAIYLFIYLLTYLSTYLHTFILFLLTYLLIYSLTFLIIHSLTYLLTNLFIPTHDHSLLHQKPAPQLTGKLYDAQNEKVQVHVASQIL